MNEWENTAELIARHRLMAIVRSDDLEHALRVVAALVEGGVRVIEFSLAGGAAIPALKVAARDHGDHVLLGVGTVLREVDVDAAIADGARFLISPDLNEAVHVAALQRGVLHIPGVFTPSEVAHAIRLEAPMLKLFPAAQLGPGYLKDLAGPFPGLRVLASGGIGSHNALEFLAAGCVAVAVGGALATADPKLARQLVDLTTTESGR